MIRLKKKKTDMFIKHYTALNPPENIVSADL